MEWLKWNSSVSHINYYMANKCRASHLNATLTSTYEDVVPRALGTPPTMETFRDNVRLRHWGRYHSTAPLSIRLVSVSKTLRGTIWRIYQTLTDIIFGEWNAQIIRTIIIYFFKDPQAFNLKNVGKSIPNQLPCLIKSSNFCSFMNTVILVKWHFYSFCL